MVAETDVKIEQQVWSLRVFDAPPVDRIALLVGDTLHNLRQSLDHLAYSLAWKLRQAEPPENTGFPLAEDASQFDGSLGNVGPIKAMPDALIEALRRVQPYNGGHYRLLLALKEMHDRDKHREPTVVAGGAFHGTTGIDSIALQPGRGGIGTPARGFTKDGDPMFILTGRLVPESYFNVEFQFAPEVAFGGGTPIVAGHPVMPILIDMRRLILAEVATPIERFL